MIGSRVLFEREAWTAAALVGRDPLGHLGTGGIVYRLERMTQPAPWRPSRRVVAYASVAQWTMVLLEMP